MFSFFSNLKVLGKKEIVRDNLVAYALVAQLDRVPGYEPGGQRFESSPVRICSHNLSKKKYDPRNLLLRSL